MAIHNILKQTNSINNLPVTGDTIYDSSSCECKIYDGSGFITINNTMAATEQNTIKLFDIEFNKQEIQLLMKLIQDMKPKYPEYFI